MEAGNNKKTAISITEKLGLIQHELKAPKTETGRFGKHRNAEGILQELKPLLDKHKCAVVLDNEIVEIGGRNYVRAVATLIDCEQDGQVSADAYAWEGDLSRGLDAPQVTGAATSYARKYALGGLFAIDDGKDDPDSHKEAPASPEAWRTKPAVKVVSRDEAKASAKQIEMISNMAKERFATKDEFKQFAETTVGADDNLTLKQASKLITQMLTLDKLESDDDNEG